MLAIGTCRCAPLPPRVPTPTISTVDCPVPGQGSCGLLPGRVYAAGSSGVGGAGDTDGEGLALAGAPVDSHVGPACRPGQNATAAATAPAATTATAQTTTSRYRRCAG